MIWGGSLTLASSPKPRGLSLSIPTPCAATGTLEYGRRNPLWRCGHAGVMAAPEDIPGAVVGIQEGAADTPEAGDAAARAAERIPRSPETDLSPPTTLAFSIKCWTS